MIFVASVISIVRVIPGFGVTSPFRMVTVVDMMSVGGRYRILWPYGFFM